VQNFLGYVPSGCKRACLQTGCTPRHLLQKSACSAGPASSCFANRQILLGFAVINKEDLQVPAGARMPARNVNIHKHSQTISPSNLASASLECGWGRENPTSAKGADMAFKEKIDKMISRLEEKNREERKSQMDGCHRRNARVAVLALKTGASLVLVRHGSRYGTRATRSGCGASTTESPLMRWMRRRCFAHVGSAGQSRLMQEPCDAGALF